MSAHFSSRPLGSSAGVASRGFGGAVCVFEGQLGGCTRGRRRRVEEGLRGRARRWLGCGRRVGSRRACAAASSSCWDGRVGRRWCWGTATGCRCRLRCGGSAGWRGSGGRGRRMLRNSYGMASELDVEFVAVLAECVGLERGHADEWLGVEQQQDAGDAVGERLAGSGEEFVEPGQALVLGQRRARLGGAVLDLHGGVEAGVLGGAGQRARCRVERGRGSRSASVIHQMQCVVDIMLLIGARTTGVAVDATTPSCRGFGVWRHSATPPGRSNNTRAHQQRPPPDTSPAGTPRRQPDPAPASCSRIISTRVCQSMRTTPG